MPASICKSRACNIGRSFADIVLSYKQHRDSLPCWCTRPKSTFYFWWWNVSLLENKSGTPSMSIVLQIVCFGIKLFRTNKPITLLFTSLDKNHLCFTLRIWIFGLIKGFANCLLQVPPELYAAFMAAADKGNIKSMPNRSMPAAPRPTPGVLLMGDAVNMRHPLTGGGMTVALSDIVVLRNLLRPLHNLNDAPALCKYLESFYTLRKVSSLSYYTHVQYFYNSKVLISNRV